MTGGKVGSPTGSTNYLKNADRLGAVWATRAVFCVLWED